MTTKLDQFREEVIVTLPSLRSLLAAAVLFPSPGVVDRLNAELAQTCPNDIVSRTPMPSTDDRLWLGQY